jgi:endonuclease G
MQASATIGIDLQMQLGNPSNAAADPNNHSHDLIQRTVEAIDYDDNLGEPSWAIWDLTASDVGTSGRSTSFTADTTLPSGFYAVKTGDYTYSGYDRGHMCPSADRTDNDTDNALVFIMSNIVPQTPDNNEGPWASFESYCRTLESSGGELMIICGGSGYNGSFIPSGKAAIPDYTWKIAVDVPPGSGSALSRIDASTRVICIKIPNVAGIRSNPWTQYITSASQIQADTGYTFFTALPADIALVLRAKVDGAPAPSITGFSPTVTYTNASVVISGNGFTSASVVPPSATSGPISVVAPGGLANSSSNFTVISSTPSVGMPVISQVYGGGGNSGATYKNDFIEIYNGAQPPWT